MDKPMTTITKLLKEINLDSLNQVAELPFEQYLILAESHNMAWEDTQSLYNQAMDYQKKSRSALTHANQQIPKILKLNKSPASVSQYDKNFTKINHNYVVEGSVASLYSPAAYLAELYRAARKLHKSNSVYSLDKRRPDLKSLTINQENMDKEVSTLSLVKKILWSKIEDKIKVIEDVAPEIALYQYLSTYKSTEAPYHHAYQSICQVLQERNINFHQLLNEPILTDRINKMPLFTISPGLYSILRQEVSDDIDKAMLLYKETGWSTDVIKSMVNGKEIDNSKFNPAMLEKILRVKHYQARYTISPDQALILANQFICYPNTNKEQFNKLFNNPPLNGVNFTTDSSFIINFNFNNEKNKFEDSTNTDVLKRAFRVNNSELMLMAMLASPSEDIKMIRNNSENISKLYRIRLLADVHHLTINELVMLLTILAPQSHPFIPTDSAALANLIDRVYSTTSWLDQQDWSVYELYCMTNKKYDTVRTPEIENLLNTLIAGLQNTQASEDTLDLFGN